MSTCYWHDYGYGVMITKLNINSVAKIEQLLERAPIFKAQINEYFEEIGLDTS